jgi:hypothetical protein
MFASLPVRVGDNDGVSVSMYLPETLTIVWLSRQTLSEDQLSNAGV